MRNKLFLILALVVAVPIFGAPTCRVESGGEKVLLNRRLDPAAQLSTLLKFLSQHSVSHDRAVEGIARLEKGTLKVNQLEPLSLSVARFDLAPVPTLYLGEGEFGVSAVLLYHELVHALDDRYAAKALADEKKPHSHDGLVFSAERLAYDQQQDLLNELYADYPCAPAYFEYHGARKSLITQLVSDEDLTRTYNLKL